jgi:hypothetical protein
MPALVGGAPSLPPPPPPPPPPPLPAWRHDAAGFDGGSNCGQLSWPGQRAKCDQAKSQDQRLKELEQKLTQYEVRARRTLVKLGAHVLAACSAHTAQCFPCATRIQTLTCVERVYRREREREGVTELLSLPLSLSLSAAERRGAAGGYAARRQKLSSQKGEYLLVEPERRDIKTRSCVRWLRAPAPPPVANLFVPTHHDKRIPEMNDQLPAGRPAPPATGETWPLP